MGTGRPLPKQALSITWSQDVIRGHRSRDGGASRRQIPTPRPRSVGRAPRIGGLWLPDAMSWVFQLRATDSSKPAPEPPRRQAIPPERSHVLRKWPPPPPSYGMLPPPGYAMFPLRTTRSDLGPRSEHTHRYAPICVPARHRYRGANARWIPISLIYWDWLYTRWLQAGKTSQCLGKKRGGGIKKRPRGSGPTYKM